MSALSAVFVGSDTLLLQCVESWRERGHVVTAVATDAQKVRDHCAASGIRCLPAGGPLTAQLDAVECDYLFAVTWMQLLPEAVIRKPRVAAFNFHDGPLPRYAGLNATCWAMLNGETEHAVTWHAIELTADAGDIAVQLAFPIEPEDTAFTLNARCFDYGLRSFGELCDQLQAGAAERRPQDLTQRSYFGRDARPPALAVLDFAAPVDDSVRLVRALDHGGYANPLAIAKVRAAGGFFLPGAVAPQPASGQAPGTVVACDEDGVVVACGDADLRIRSPRCLRGLPMNPDQLAQIGVAAGAVLPVSELSLRESWTRIGAAAAVGEHAWLHALRGSEPLAVAGSKPRGGAAEPVELPVDVAGADARRTAAMCVAFLLRDAGVSAADVGFTDGAAAGARGLAVECPPVRFQTQIGDSVEQALTAIAATFDEVARRGPLLRELVARRSDVLAPETVLDPLLRVTMTADLAVSAGSMTIAVGADGSVQLRFDSAAIPVAVAEALAARLRLFAIAANREPTRSLDAVPILDEAELDRLLRAWNDTEADAPTEPCIHRQFGAVAAAEPDRVALTCGDEQRTYGELAAEVDKLAGRLRGCGVQVGDRVGICTERSVGMVTAALAAQRCGAAYVPLDPDYPRDRITFMAQDAELAAMIVDSASASAAPQVSCARVDLDADAAAIAATAPLAEDAVTGADLAYMIYTSGSTGRPKGVMVRHRNVTNFFVGMDRVLGADQPRHEPGVWLAVTSLSFDISVLELLWPLCRGFHVVLHRGAAGPHAAAPAPAAAARPVSFSMFYFASDEGEHSEDKYRLLIEGAKFADANGFEAVWTPERHFHAFGGLYPNPAVAGAALATITEHVKIRAGSCVAPLHHPIRIAEDWSLVDNLSHGRVGIAFAAGWHGRDFVLRPENFEDRKGALRRTIDQVHALWRGEELAFEGHDGAVHKIRTLPRPVQAELPTWVTVAGNPETYRMAGESGSNVLTHLLGQSLEDLDGKLAIYRKAWRDAGHPGDGHVTLMLHTFVGDDEDRVRELVREPMKGYLRSSLDLVKQAAWSFPAFKNRVDEPGEMDALLNGGLTPEDFDALLDFSFERYYQQSGLFGTPDSCVAIVDRLRALRIDEIACLVDFGVATKEVMASLPHLQELKRRCDAQSTVAEDGASEQPVAAAAATIPQLIERHGVTHFQCTPSMAGMLLLDPEAGPAFGRLRHMLVGGEALPAALARQLRGVTSSLHDVYGPTETTIWSTTWPVGDEEPVPIGRPLANQQVYVLDDRLQPVPTGRTGELWIGGDGVTAGYFRRPELTDEKFREDPFRCVPGAKIYATGDFARWRPDGVLEYLGRKDLQVKVRGYRIELGEIEAALSRHAGVQEAVVLARTDADESRLVAYLVADGSPLDSDELRAHLRESLPEFMVPSAFVMMAEMPRTPNMKVDRKALPAPEAVAAPARREVAAAADDTEGAILEVWKSSLGTDDVGVEDNFFDSGGHSILAVKVHREITQRLGVELAVTDLFRFTTVRALAAHLRTGSSNEPTAAQKAAARAKARRVKMRRR